MSMNKQNRTHQRTIKVAVAVVAVLVGGGKAVAACADANRRGDAKASIGKLQLALRVAALEVRAKREMQK